VVLIIWTGCTSRGVRRRFEKAEGSGLHAASHPDLRDLLRGADHLGGRLELLHNGVDGGLDASPQVHGVHARRDGLAALTQDGARQHRRCRCACSAPKQLGCCGPTLVPRHRGSETAAVVVHTVHEAQQGSAILCRQASIGSTVVTRPPRNRPQSVYENPSPGLETGVLTARAINHEVVLSSRRPQAKLQFAMTPAGTTDSFPCERTISRDVIGGRRHLLHEAGTNVLEAVLEFNALCDRHAVLRDLRGAIGLLDHNVAAL
jgi:hypothetical protein